MPRLAERYGRLEGGPEVGHGRVDGAVGERGSREAHPDGDIRAEGHTFAAFPRVEPPAQEIGERLIRPVELVEQGRVLDPKIVPGVDEVAMRLEPRQPLPRLDVLTLEQLIEFIEDPGVRRIGGERSQVRATCRDRPVPGVGIGDAEVTVDGREGRVERPGAFPLRDRIAIAAAVVVQVPEVVRRAGVVGHSGLRRGQDLDLLEADREAAVRWHPTATSVGGECAGAIARSVEQPAQRVGNQRIGRAGGARRRKGRVEDLDRLGQEPGARVVVGDIEGGLRIPGAQGHGTPLLVGRSPRDGDAAHPAVERVDGQRLGRNRPSTLEIPGPAPKGGLEGMRRGMPRLRVEGLLDVTQSAWQVAGASPQLGEGVEGRPLPRPVPGSLGEGVLGLGEPAL